MPLGHPVAYFQNLALLQCFTALQTGFDSVNDDVCSCEAVAAVDDYLPYSMNLWALGSACVHRCLYSRLDDERQGQLTKGRTLRAWRSRGEVSASLTGSSDGTLEEACLINLSQLQEVQHLLYFKMRWHE